MSLEIKKKLNTLINDWPAGAVFVTSWLKKTGYSDQLLNRYKNSQWLSTIGSGALIRTGDSVSYQGAIYALQNQLDSSIHVGARTALALHGKAHYLQLSNTKALIFGAVGEKLPNWFTKWDWGLKVEYHSTSFIPPKLGLVDFELKNFSIKISSPARAILECLYLAPEKQELMECYELMEGLTNLRPQQVNELLEACSSVKVKRLFLYLAKKANHDWVQYLNLPNITLGAGKRSIVKDGTYISEFKITVPSELAKNGLL